MFCCFVGFFIVFALSSSCRDGSHVTDDSDIISLREGKREPMEELDRKISSQYLFSSHVSATNSSPCFLFSFVANRAFWYIEML